MIDKDIKNLKEITDLVKEEIINNDENTTATLDIIDLKSLDTVLKELEKYKKLVDKYGGAEQLQKYIWEISKVLGDVSICAMKTVIEDKDKELETYKKMAEILADTLRYYNGMQQVQEFCIDICEDKLCDEENCKQCIIDWAKKEVSKTNFDVEEHIENKIKKAEKQKTAFPMD